MHSIAELYNTHQGEEVWIIGSDPTLDDYPDDFMDDKTGMALHLAYIKFHTKYAYANELDRVKYLRANFPDYLSATKIYGLPFFQRTMEESLKYVDDTCYALDLNGYPPNGNIHDALTDLGQDYLRKQLHWARDNSSATCGDFGTCLHCCFWSAILMGFTTIHIIGAGMTTINGANHFGKAEPEDKIQRPTVPNFSDNAHEERVKATEVLIDEARKMGLTVFWHKTYQEVAGLLSLSRAIPESL